MNISDLLEFWPEKTAVKKSCFHLAESLDDATLLAIHGPIEFIELNAYQFKNTIQSMYNHSNKGVIMLLDGNVHNPGNVFNWAQDSFGSTALDHSFSETEYVLVIYK